MFAMLKFASKSNLVPFETDDSYLYAYRKIQHQSNHLWFENFISHSIGISCIKKAKFAQRWTNGWINVLFCFAVMLMLMMMTNGKLGKSMAFFCYLNRMIHLHVGLFFKKKKKLIFIINANTYWWFKHRSNRETERDRERTSDFHQNSSASIENDE